MITISQGPEGGPPESSILAKFWKPGQSKVPFFRYLYDPNVAWMTRGVDSTMLPIGLGNLRHLGN